MGRIVKNDNNGYFEMTLPAQVGPHVEKGRQQLIDLATERGAIDAEIIEENNRWHFVAEFEDVSKLIMFQDHMTTLMGVKAQFDGPDADEIHALADLYVDLRKKAN